jgi:L-serine dehydratase
MISVFDLFKIGIGPSSSHTVGPMTAARSFGAALVETGLLPRTGRVVVTLFGSLAWTGKGHATDTAVMLGLAGERPATVEPQAAAEIVDKAMRGKSLWLSGRHMIAFDPESCIVYDRKSKPPQHPNTLAFDAFDAGGVLLLSQRWCSIGGGFVVPEGSGASVSGHAISVPYPFGSADELLATGKRTGLTIAEIVWANECALRDEDAVVAHLRHVAEVMFGCIDRGLRTNGTLPGTLNVRRRAPGLYARIEASEGSNAQSPHRVMDVISVFAIAVNEENAAGGRVVTAPTNGAAGVVPAVLRYYRDFCSGASPESIDQFLLTASAVGALFKMNASISGAEVGCQGEVGVACSMAAAGLCAALGGSNAQIENAAEIGMEHHLGMTCDPIGGLVQIPCIERNAFGAIKAVNASSLALSGDGSHKVSLDQVIATMRQTGADMNHKYKETSQGGLAVNWVEC